MSQYDNPAEAGMMAGRAENFRLPPAEAFALLGFKVEDAGGCTALVRDYGDGTCHRLTLKNAPDKAPESWDDVVVCGLFERGPTGWNWFTAVADDFTNSLEGVFYEFLNGPAHGPPA